MHSLMRSKIYIKDSINVSKEINKKFNKEKKNKSILDLGSNYVTFLKK